MDTYYNFCISLKYLHACLQYFNIVLLNSNILSKDLLKTLDTLDAKIVFVNKFFTSSSLISNFSLILFKILSNNGVGISCNVL